MSSNPIDLLSCALYNKMEHLDPSTDEIDWHDLSEWEKDYYRTCVRYLLADADLVRRALSFACNDHISRCAEKRE
jgi:hypothetical protein